MRQLMVLLTPLFSVLLLGSCASTPPTADYASQVHEKQLRLAEHAQTLRQREIDASLQRQSERQLETRPTRPPPSGDE